MHSKGIKKDCFMNKKSNYKIIATSIGDDNTEFISIFEHSKYPIYAVQFHPERTIYEMIEQHDLHRSFSKSM